MGSLANHADRAAAADRPVDDAGSESEFAATVAGPPRVPEGDEPLDIHTDTGEASLPGDIAAQPTLSTIGRYALKQRLGEGGLGFVYEAWDPLLSRTVAVKTLQFDIDAPTRLALDRLFLNEARAAAGLNHPHIVTVYDAGLSAHGVYIAMERLRGRDLRQALAAGWQPTPAQAAQLVRRVADALAYAHARGVVHCDVKPANIFLTRKDRPTLLDFGIARVAHGAAVPGMDGLVAGSPHYLSPEQLQGGAVDGRTDVYALGVVLYELLTGRKAFDGASMEQITHAVLHNQPAPADALQPAVPPGLAAVVAQAMARDPAQRPAGAAELALALRPWQGAGAATDGADSADGSDGSPPAPRGRRPAWRATLAVAAVAAAAVVAWAALRPGPAAQAPVQAGAAPSATVAADAPAAGGAVTAGGVLAAGGTNETNDTNDTNGPVGAGGAGAEAGADGSAAATAAAAAPPAAPAARPPAARRGSATPPAARPPARTVPPPPAAPATGLVQLAISPWGEVEVDGRAAGVTPPLTRLTLPEGTHAITLRNGDFPAHTIEVQVTADQPVTLRHRFGS